MTTRNGFKKTCLNVRIFIMFVLWNLYGINLIYYMKLPFIHI